MYNGRDPIEFTTLVQQLMMARTVLLCHCMLYAVHCMLYAVHCILNFVPRILYVVHCMRLCQRTICVAHYLSNNLLIV